MGPFLTKDEVCAKLSIPPGTLRGIMERRELPHYKIGGCVRFDEADVAEYVRRRVVRPCPAPVKSIPQASAVNRRGRPTIPAADGYYPGKKVV